MKRNGPVGHKQQREARSSLEGMNSQDRAIGTTEDVSNQNRILQPIKMLFRDQM